MPLKGEQLMRKPGEDGVVMGCVRQIHRHDSDFRPDPRVDTRPQTGGEELSSKANAPVGLPGEHGFPYPALLGSQPRKCSVVVHAHRAAHRDDGVEASPIGELLPFVDFNPVDRSPFLYQDVFIDTGGLARDMLQNQDPHSRSSWRQDYPRRMKGEISMSVVTAIDMVPRCRREPRVCPCFIAGFKGRTLQGANTRFAPTLVTPSRIPHA